MVNEDSLFLSDEEFLKELESNPVALNQPEPTEPEEIVNNEVAPAVTVPSEEVFIQPDLPEDIDYKAEYEALFQPIKADGKTFVPRDKDEIVKLMQQGVNFTRKSQELAKHSKLVAMLEGNKIDENKLSFFIDLQNKDKSAIGKLIKDSEIDPYDLDPEDLPEYTENKHVISDSKFLFDSEVDKVNSNTFGQETITHILNTWDKSSQSKLAQHPGTLEFINHCRETGDYDVVVRELDRQKVLGNINNNTDFFDGYKQVVGALYNQNKLPSQQKVIAQRAATTKSNMNNSRVASASSTTRTHNKTVSNNLEELLLMSDEDFMKSIKNKR